MKIVSCISIMFFLVATMNAQDLKQIKLPTPNKTKGASIMKAFNDRHSDRTFASDKLSQQDLSDLLWATNGINRPDGKRTAPSCMNFQEVGVYVIFPEGAYRYDEKAHALTLLTEGDYRTAVAGGQDFAKTAPLSIVLSADLTRFGGTINEGAKLMASVDIGIVCQNINLACAGLGLATVPRATMDKNTLKKVLKLKDTDLLLMNNPVGYPKK
ncbi:SagB/ThcOx family dehydrogenase [uncultured Bacteroides sp.]|uniref:SagB/ThcOx family dehydrogenase n=1 Tax=uncultured Bacteroides sp. TaxID=162156 RepID=UPI002AA8B138|nr:SagB/ThcOx family dehydrogenase [uncultured Bacteroides sp.]